MKRREFIKSLPKIGSTIAFLNGIPLSEMALAGHLQQMALNSHNDKKLVIIQLHGGNDGLNSVIPLSNYDTYFNLRPRIAIPKKGSRKLITLDSSLKENQFVGLHPDLSGFKHLYDQGSAAIVQNVAYKNLNQSHFRSTNIWLMGGSAEDNFHSGWAGRYLGSSFPDYPDAYPNERMKDPLAIEIGKSISLMFHRDDGVPAGISFTDPKQFYKLISQVGANLPLYDKSSRSGKELNWIMNIEKKSNQYAKRLDEVFKKGTNTVEYPTKYPEFAPFQFKNNHLAPQLQMIGRLLSGGCNTKIFLAKLGGFDTHFRQVEGGEPSKGAHAALQYHLSSSIKAFYEDLEKQGLSDNVLTMTFSEFGRRAATTHEGTDHGIAAPMFLFNKNLNAGVYGNNADLNDLDDGNIKGVFDYRQVLTSILADWFEADDEVIRNVRMSEFVENRLNLFGKQLSPKPVEEEDKDTFWCQAFPNPASDYIYFKYNVPDPKLYVSLIIYGSAGPVLIPVNGGADAATVKVDIRKLNPGMYSYRLKAGPDLQINDVFVKE